MQEKFIPFGLNSIEVSESQNFYPDKNCNSLAFTNLGDTIVKVNGITLFPSSAPATIAGDSVEISGNSLEVFKSYVTISFIAPVGALPRLQIAQTYYHQKQNA